MFALMHRALRLCAIAFAAGLVLANAPAARADAPDAIVVFAAASLKTALDRVAGDWTAKTGITVRISYAGSSRLARQIERGAPADVFLSANVQWMDALEAKGLIDKASRQNLLTNRLVLIAHGRDAAPMVMEPGFDLVARLDDGRLAMAMVDAVPAGIYGKAALLNLGVWQVVAARVAQTDNVRMALQLVARGEAPLGIVYRSDAEASDDVTVVATFPAPTHPPIVYPVAQVASRPHADVAKRFIAHLNTPSATAHFERQGFAVFAPAPTH